jgi:hypothetical protein
MGREGATLNSSGNMLRYVTIRKFSSESGYSEAAVRSKIRDSVWVEGGVWVRAPDGRILIDVLGYENWVESGIQPRTRTQGPRGRGSPPPLT